VKLFFFWAGLCGLSLTALTASDDLLDLAPRMVKAGGGNLQIIAEDPVAAQTMAVWSSRALDTIQKRWNRRIPFNKRQPLRIRLSAKVTAVDLREQHVQGRVLQELLVPADAEAQKPLEVADGLTRAFAQRLLWQDLSKANPKAEPQVPDWWVWGNSASMLQGGMQGAMEAWFRKTRGATRSFPESISQRSGREPDLLERAEAILLCRFFQDTVSSDMLWAELGRMEITEEQRWLNCSGAQDMRQLHILWEVWLESSLPPLAAELALEALALELLESRRVLHPARFGLRGLPERYQPLQLEDLLSVEDPSGVVAVIDRWRLDLQPLSFRQSELFRECVQAYMQAGGYLREAVTQPQQRETALKTMRQELVTATERYHQLRLRHAGEAPAL
jgi:hypothetical protein